MVQFLSFLFSFTPLQGSKVCQAADVSARLTESVDPYSKDDQAKFAKW